MRRRDFSRGLVAWVLACPGAVRAQAGLPRVIVVGGNERDFFRPYFASFEQGLREAGQEPGRTLELDVLYGRDERTPVADLVRDAVARKPAVIVVGGLVAARHARDATTTIPVVVATASDLVDAGIVASYARPGGNVTGITDLADVAAVKRLELLRELMPKLARIALLLDPGFPATPKVEQAVRAAAARLQVAIARLDAHDRDSLAQVAGALDPARVDAVLTGPSAVYARNAGVLIERATLRRVPVVHFWPGTAEQGAIFSLQADSFRNWARAAWYVDRILRGARPRDLPVEQPARYELVVNRTAALALGVVPPERFLLRADRVL